MAMTPNCHNPFFQHVHGHQSLQFLFSHHTSSQLLLSFHPNVSTRDGRRWVKTLMEKSERWNMRSDVRVWQVSRDATVQTHARTPTETATDTQHVKPYNNAAAQQHRKQLNNGHMNTRIHAHIATCVALVTVNLNIHIHINIYEHGIYQNW